MSKRGQILKKTKEHMLGIVEVGKLVKDLPPEDLLWIGKKIEAFSKKINFENAGEPHATYLNPLDNSPF